MYPFYLFNNKNQHQKWPLIHENKREKIKMNDFKIDVIYIK